MPIPVWCKSTRLKRQRVLMTTLKSQNVHHQMHYDVLNAVRWSDEWIVQRVTFRRWVIAAIKDWWMKIYWAVLHDTRVLRADRRTDYLCHYGAGTGGGGERGHSQQRISVWCGTRVQTITLDHLETDDGWLRWHWTNQRGPGTMIHAVLSRSRHCYNWPRYTLGELQQRSSNIHSVQCNSTEWRFERLISPNNSWVRLILTWELVLCSCNDFHDECT